MAGLAVGYTADWPPALSGQQAADDGTGHTADGHASASFDRA